MRPPKRAPISKTKVAKSYKNSLTKWLYCHTVLSHTSPSWIAVSKPKNLLQQSNSFDCGVFISLYARCLVAEGVMLSDEQSISDFREHMLLELHSQSLIPVSSATYHIKKGSFYAIDYVNNYYISRALNAPDTRNFAEFKFLHQIRKTNIKRFEWPNHDDIDCVHSSCIFYGPLNLRARPWPLWDSGHWGTEAVFKLVSK